MTGFRASIVATALLFAAKRSHAAEVFVDDLGVEHARVDNPRLVLSAQVAVSLRHLGKSTPGTLTAL